MMKNVVITGVGSGLGKEIAIQFKNQKDEFNVIGIDVFMPDDSYEYVDCFIRHDVRCNLFAEGSGIDGCDILINNAGVNYINNFEDISIADWDRVIDTNVKSIFKMSKSFLSMLKESGGTIMNVVSNAHRMPMTHSAAYNASKGAAEILTRQMARELTKRFGITVFGINPNKLSGTGMSNYIDDRVQELRGWTAEQAKEYQMTSLLSGEETNPEDVAELVVWLLSEKRRHKYLTGCLLDLGL